MMHQQKYVLAGFVVLFATFAVAKDDTLPRIDLEKSCGVRAKASAEMMGDKSATTAAFDTCMKSEQQARDALEAAWKDVPASYKAACVNSTAFSPSYVEWISCVELGIDVKKLRAKN